MRVQFQGYKHTSLVFLVATLYELRLERVLRRSLARRRIGRPAYKANLITIHAEVTHLRDAPVGEPRFDGAVGQQIGAKESHSLYSEALLPGARSPRAVCDGAGSRENLGKKEAPS
jgi:hypothetical protein